jgi:hypothetical protein
MVGAWTYRPDCINKNKCIALRLHLFVILYIKPQDEIPQDEIPQIRYSSIADCYIENLDSVENIINELNAYIKLSLNLIKNHSSKNNTFPQIHDDDLNIIYNKCNENIIISNNGVSRTIALDNTAFPSFRGVVINYKFEEINKYNQFLIPVNYRSEQLLFNSGELLENNVAMKFFSGEMFDNWKFNTFISNVSAVTPKFFEPAVIDVSTLSNNIIMTSSLSEYDPDNFLATIQSYNSVYSKYFTISKTVSFWIYFYDNNHNPIDVLYLVTNIFIELELTL